MEKSYKVPFAYDSDGTMVDYVSAVKGVHYTCECGKKVALRGGDKVTLHLYHTEPTECNGESIVHKAYKNAFERLKCIALPYPVNGEDKLFFDRIEIEKRFYDFIPDAIGYINEVPYLIEFAHTSFIKERKLNKIKEANVFCIEVKINKEFDRFDDIKNHIKNLRLFKEIVYIPNYAEGEKIRENFLKVWKGCLEKIDCLDKENKQLKLEIDKLKNINRSIRESMTDLNQRISEKIKNIIIKSI